MILGDICVRFLPARKRDKRLRDGKNNPNICEPATENEKEAQDEI
jgi:hypothetical protein